MGERSKFAWSFSYLFSTWSWNSGNEWLEFYQQLYLTHRKMLSGIASPVLSCVLNINHTRNVDQVAWSGCKHFWALFKWEYDMGDTLDRVGHYKSERNLFFLIISELDWKLIDVHRCWLKNHFLVLCKPAVTNVQYTLIFPLFK